MSYLQELSSISQPQNTARRGVRSKVFQPDFPTPEPQQNLTAQQIALAYTPISGLVRANAYAGAGKTATLTVLAANNPNKRCVYLAYNKSAQQDAAARFGRNTRCTTVHGLAFASCGRKYDHKLGKIRAIDIIRQMGLSWDWGFASAIIDTIAAWCVSDWDDFPTMACTINGPMYGNPRDLIEVADVAKLVWARMCNENDPMPMSHDGYLKLHQLSKPRINCDLLMLDEAQDTNPVTWAIVRSQTCPIVVVGDRYQSIYKFRGAINAMDAVTPDQEFPLTQSFRFGERVARIASELLCAYYDETVPVEGLGPDTLIAPPPPGASHAVLARTNAIIFHHAAQCLRSGSKLGFVGGVNAYGFEKLLDAYNLSVNRHDMVRDSFIRDFDKFSEFEKYATDSGDMEAKRQVEIVKTYGASLQTIIPEIQLSAQTDLSKAEVVLATAHRSKGMTVDHVVLAEDFPAIVCDEGMLFDEENLDRQEVNLLYVALTRARKTIKINQTTQDFVFACGASSVLKK